MPFGDLRKFLSHLQDHGELARVSKELDDQQGFEVSAVLDRLQRSRGKAVVFEKLKSCGMPMCANVLGSFGRIALALETSEEKLFSEWAKRKQSAWPSPRLVFDGACSETAITEENVNLYSYPALKWNPLDGGRYITLGAVITKDPQTQQRNVGIYRLMILGRRHLAINMAPQRHITAHYGKAESMGKPLEVAVAIGLDPAVTLAAATDLKLGDDEFAFAGVLRGEPLKLTGCKAVDVEVPASAEIVLEGVIQPKVRVLEGPFAESTGYYSKALPQPIMKVKAIMQREKPIFQASYSGKPPQEEHFLTAFNCPNLNQSTKSFAQKRTAKGILDGAHAKISRRITSQPVRLPGKDVDWVARNWAEYGLE